jgi:hypothetical protein
MKKSKRRRFVEDLDFLDVETDPEKGHAMADDILLAAVPEQIRLAYQRAIDRAPWWADA